MTDASGKTCSSCGEHQPFGNYGVDNQKRDGLTSQCRACRNKDGRRYANTDEGRESARRRNARFAEANPDRVASAQKAWRAKHPGYSAKANAEWRAAHPEASAAYYQANRERLLQRNAEWLAENAERKRETNRAWRVANPERESATTRRWQKANPEKAREIALRRRARKLAASTGPVDVELLWKMSLGFCGLCSGPINRRIQYPDPLSKSLDHIVPLSKGGSHSQSNVQWTHLVCNLRKGATVPN